MACTPAYGSIPLNETPRYLDPRSGPSLRCRRHTATPWASVTNCAENRWRECCHDLGKSSDGGVDAAAVCTARSTRKRLSREAGTHCCPYGGGRVDRRGGSPPW